MAAYNVPAEWTAEMGERVEAPEVSARLARCVGLISKYAKSLNLSGSSSPVELSNQAGEAVLAVLAVEAVLGRRLGPSDRWLDVGSGGGFPGLVVAAVAETQLRLVEPRQRRAAFLEMGLGACGRRGELVYRGRLEEEGLAVKGADLGAWVGEGVDVASARAVFSPSEWLKRGSGLLGSEGLLLLHLHVGDAPPPGCFELARREWGGWAAVVVRPDPQ